MCGIAGAVWASDAASPIDDPILAAMSDAMVHRGPDDSGIRVGPGHALLSRRLAILDLSERGRMPMSTPDGRFSIVYNGEVYNFREVRKRLEGLGRSFGTGTDTEVLLHAYAEWGPAMLEALNGMFAFAIWDDRERTLFAARDRLGVKPFHYAEWEGRFLFASEPKSLFAAGVPARMAEGVLPDLVCFGYAAGERTAFEGIRRLLPGRWLHWRDGRVETGRWWHLAERIRVHRADLPSDPISWFRKTFDDSIEFRRIADVPVGVLLSGGLDSSCVAGSLATLAGPDVRSFTVRFDRPPYDEGPLAQSVVRKYGLEAHELRIGDEDVLAGLKRAAAFNDEPLVHGSDAHLMAIAELAKPRVTVLLSGEGADEILGGYVRYQPLRYPSLLGLARRASGLARFGGPRLTKLRRFLNLGDIERFVYFNSCKLLPFEVESLGPDASVLDPYRLSVLDEARELYPDEPARQAMYLDQLTFLGSVLDRNDRMTMAVSVECREPFLDYRLVEMAGALPTSRLFAGREGKVILRKALGDRLPPEVLRHKKWGFGVPWGDLVRRPGPFRDYVAALPGLSPISEPPFDPAGVHGAVDAALAGDARAVPRVLSMVLLALWHETVLETRNKGIGSGGGPFRAA